MARRPELKHLPVKDVAEILGLKPETITKMIREGKFEGVIKVSGVWLIPDWSMQKVKEIRDRKGELIRKVSYIDPKTGKEI